MKNLVGFLFSSFFGIFLTTALAAKPLVSPKALVANGKPSTIVRQRSHTWPEKMHGTKGATLARGVRLLHGTDNTLSVRDISRYPITRLLFTNSTLWSACDGPYGGLIPSVAVSPTGYVFVGTYRKGVYRSSNDGGNWTQTGLGRGTVLPLSVDSYGNLYAGMIDSTGVFISTDDGNSWAHSQLNDGRVYSIGISPSGHIFAGVDTGEVFLSTDKGTNWTLMGSVTKTVNCFAFDSSGNILAGTGDGILSSGDQGKTWSQLGYLNITVNDIWVSPTGDIFAASSDGVIVSSDEGTTWIQSGIPDYYVLSFTINASGDMFAGVDGGGVFVSSDNGSTWVNKSLGLRNGVIYSLSSTPSGDVFAVTDGGGIYLSTDNGGTWARKSNGLENELVYQISTADSGALLLGTYGDGVYISSDGGSNWNSGGPIAMSYVRSISNMITGEIFVGTPTGRIFGSTDDGAEWTEKTNLSSIGVAGNVNALSLLSADTLLAAADDGLHISTDSAGSWNPVQGAISTSGRVYCILVDRSRNSILAGTESGIFLSEDGGVDWVKTSMPGVPVFALARNWLGYVFAGTGGNGVYLSTDRGNSWSPTGLGSGDVHSLAVDSLGHDFASVFQGTMPYVQGGVVYTSTDNGVTWYQATSGLPDFAVTSLTAGGSGYVFAGTDGSGVYRTSAPVSLLLPPVAPSLASPLDGESVVPQNVTLSWYKSPGARNYFIELGTDSSFSSGIILADSTLTDSSENLTGLSTTTTYFWRVAASDSTGRGAWSEVWHFTTGNVPAAVPSAPMLASPADDTTGISQNPAFTWNASGGATSYQFQLSSDSAFSPAVYDTSGLTTTSFQASGLADTTTYFWRVNASNSAGASPWSEVWHFTTGNVPATIPPAPMLASPADDTTGISTSPAFTWNASGGAKSYQFQLSTDSTFTPTVYDTSGLTATSFQAAGLDTSATYYWRVNASDSGGTSQWSKIWHFTTASDTAPGAPLLIAPDGGPNNVATDPLLRWNASAGDSVTYTLQVATPGNFSTPLFNRSGLTSPSQRVPNLVTGTTYDWRVDAANKAGTSAWSSSSFTTFSYPSQIQLSLQFTPPGTKDISNYRIVGLPGQVDIPVSSQLLGNEGSDWEVYWDNGAPDNYQVKYDGSSTFDFLPGRAFWIFTDNPFTVQQNESSVALDTGDCYPIPLHDGWNLIADPFEKSIIWSVVQGLYPPADSIQPIWSFDRIGYLQSTTLEPYVGYYYYNLKNLASIRIPYVYNVTSRTKPSFSYEKVSSIQKDLVQLSISSGNIGAIPIYVGFTGNASDTLKKADIFAPPDYFDKLRIQVVDQNVGGYWKELYSDFRNQIGKGQSFDIEVKNLTGRSSAITADLTGGFDNYSVYLVDNGTHAFYDLKSVDSISISKTYEHKSFTLLIGDENYIDSVRTALAPKSYRLFQNYPNPFNPTTTIRYEIPKRADVTVKVYNVLGELVGTLVDEAQQAGFYEVDFNGAGLASGVYFCRIEAGGISQVKKMVLLK